MMFKPDLALETLIMAFWIESILSWIAWVVFAIKDKEFEESWLLAGLSIFWILLWVALLFFPQFGEVILRIFVVLVWILVIIKSIVLIIDSVELKKSGFEKWWWALAAWIVMLFLGIFLVMNSLLVILIVNGIIGLWVTILGISMVVWACQIRKILR